MVYSLWKFEVMCLIEITGKVKNKPISKIERTELNFSQKLASSSRLIAPALMHEHKMPIMYDSRTKRSKAFQKIL